MLQACILYDPNAKYILQELDALCGKGEAQTELVMLVMMRLAEDVVLLQTLEQPQRRKEIHAALVAHMEQIFAFLLQVRNA